ncbi:hypothetical protein ACFQPA_06300 [Halomarina halobia]|uniref:Tryptophan--tRNA ligase n=1 Tax=Halomarina halobia TaxID=3033386 RepID=A0ABD6A765_9EURY|nr:hypothetical protein [Halomarina sp. PSR21]
MSDLLRDHRRTLVEDRGFERADFAVGDVSATEVERTFAVGDRGRAFASRIDAGEPALVTSGVSMTGPPHVGTLGQVLTAVRLQEAGLDVQLVLADLPAYLAAGRGLNEVRALAGRYRSFAVELGFDERAGTLRTQLDAPGALRTAMLLSRYYDPDGEAADAPEEAGEDDGSAPVSDPEPTAFESELAAAYESAETPDVETPRFAGAQTGLLLAADTLHPIVTGGYEHVCFVGGSDNHGLSSFVRRVLDASPYAGTVAGLYTRLVPGLAGYPKMSKSLPRSNVSLAEDSETVRERVLADDGLRDPLLLEMIRVASPYSTAEFEEVREAFDRRDGEWTAAKRAYADFFADAAAVWG